MIFILWGRCGVEDESARFPLGRLFQYKEKVVRFSFILTAATSLIFVAAKAPLVFPN